MADSSLLSASGSLA